MCDAVSRRTAREAKWHGVFNRCAPPSSCVIALHPVMGRPAVMRCRRTASASSSTIKWWNTTAGAKSSCSTRSPAADAVSRNRAIELPALSCVAKYATAAGRCPKSFARSGITAGTTSANDESVSAATHRMHRNTPLTRTIKAVFMKQA